MNGFLLIDKAKGQTSFDVIKDLRKLTGEKKIGHAGTLDPLATGLLLVALGEGTKLLEYFTACDKEYIVKAKFGFKSDTLDADGEISFCSHDEFEVNQLKNLIDENFLGIITQIPPKYSAIKVKGRRAYDLARAGKDFEMKSRVVKVDLFEILSFNWPFVEFRVSCGSGTYVRSLIDELGTRLGCGAYVEELRRTKLGDYSVDSAVKVEVVGKKIDQQVVLISGMLKGFARIDLSNEDFEGLKDGKILMGKKVEQNIPVVAFYKGKLLGIVGNFKDLGIKYAKLFNL